MNISSTDSDEDMVELPSSPVFKDSDEDMVLEENTHDLRLAQNTGIVGWTHLVLSSGGLKGISQLGALHQLCVTGKLDISKVHTYAGSSIGSIICFLLIIGYEPIEIFQKIYSSEYFIKSERNSLWDIINKYGLMNIKSHFDYFFMPIIRDKINKIPTLAEIKERYDKNLYITVTNETDMTVEYFSHLTHPDILVTDALMYSCNIPFVFQRISYKGKYYIDGAVLDSFPIDILNKINPFSLGIDNKILGIVTTTDTPDNSNNILNNNFITYLYRIISMIMINNLGNHIEDVKKRENVNVVEIKVDAPIIQISLSSDEKMRLFITGKNSVSEL